MTDFDHSPLSQQQLFVQQQQFFSVGAKRSNQFKLLLKEDSKSFVVNKPFVSRSKTGEPINFLHVKIIRNTWRR